MDLRAGEIQPVNFTYTLTNGNGDRIPLELTECERDLGVTMTPDLTFSRHIKIISGKSRSIIGVLADTFLCRDLELWAKLYSTFGAPILSLQHQSGLQRKRQDPRGRPKIGDPHPGLHKTSELQQALQ